MAGRTFRLKETLETGLEELENELEEELVELKEIFLEEVAEGVSSI